MYKSELVYMMSNFYKKPESKYRKLKKKQLWRMRYNILRDRGEVVSNGVFKAID